MSNIVIVALPEEDDPVWKISSEKVPHMTILFLGDTISEPGKVMEFLEHACNTMLRPFYMSVDRRGVLGPDEADVVFFNTEWDFQDLSNFRKQLLNNDLINAAYNSVPQFPVWQPHLTLGYPVTPAKPTERKLYDVFFDRIALWVEDSDGPEIVLQRPKYNLEVSMSNTQAVIDEFLAHHGVKGMKWGVRKERGPAGPPTEVKSKTVIHPDPKKPTTVKVSGGENHPAVKEAIKVAESKQKLHKSGAAALSNEELQQLVTRLNLEQQAKRLAPAPASTSRRIITSSGKVSADINTLLNYGNTIKRLHSEASKLSDK